MTGSDVAPPRVIAGLGNPGPDYANTRHNVGFMVLEKLADRSGGPFREERAWHSELARMDSVLLVKPLTFMNESGSAIGRLVRFFKIDPPALLVVYDDKDLPLGQLRLRASGSAGSHNGMASVIRHLSTDRIPRLRVGIGSGRGRLRDHVLSKFAEEEADTVASAISRAVEAVDCIYREGFAAAMNQFNQKKNEEPL